MMSGRSSAVFPWAGLNRVGTSHPAGGVSLCPRLCALPFTKAHAWATTILFNEHYARGLQRPADGEFIGSGKRGLRVREFSAPDRVYA